MDFSLFLLALYLLRDNFLVSEMTSIHVNNTTKKTPCQPVCAFSWHADSRKRVHFHSFSGFERGVNEVCTLLGFYAASIGSFFPTFRDNSRWWWNSHSGVGEDASHLGRFAVSTGQFTLSSGPTTKTMALRSTETSVTLHHLCENVISYRTKNRAGPRLLRICEDHCRIRKSPILDIFFILSIMIDYNSG